MTAPAYRFRVLDLAHGEHAEQALRLWATAWWTLVDRRSTVDEALYVLDGAPWTDPSGAACVLWLAHSDHSRSLPLVRRILAEVRAEVASDRAGSA